MILQQPFLPVKIVSKFALESATVVYICTQHSFVIKIGVWQVLTTYSKAFNLQLLLPIPKIFKVNFSTLLQPSLSILFNFPTEKNIFWLAIFTHNTPAHIHTCTLRALSAHAARRERDERYYIQNGKLCVDFTSHGLV